MIHEYLKKTAVITLFFFIWFILGTGVTHSTNTVDRIQKMEKIKSEKTDGDKEIGPSDEGTEPASPNVVEKPAEKKKRKKKFPVLLVVVGLIAIGAIVYFVLKKTKDKEYTLTVNVGEGVTGAPASGTYTYKKRETVNYTYSLQTGYTDLSVMLDGQAVSSEGTFTMDADRSLVVSTTPVATVKVKSTPTGANIYMDGNDTGKKTNHTFTFTSAGTHTIVLRKLGYKEYETTVNAVPGQTKTVDKTLEQGLNENFNADAESSILWKWLPLETGNWKVKDGNYVAEADVYGFNYCAYNHDFNASKYTVTVKMKRSTGLAGSNAYQFVMLATGNDGRYVSGYFFSYWPIGAALGYKLRNYDIIKDTGSATQIVGKMFGGINQGLNSYNTLKIVRDGDNYTFYINDQLVKSFTDSKHDPGYLFIGGYAGKIMTKLEFDYAYIDIGNTSASVPGSPLSATQDNGSGIDHFKLFR